MDAAITVLVVLLSLLLVLGIAAYAFKMVQDSLPGNAGPNQSYPNPLNWLNNNSASNKTSTTLGETRIHSQRSRAARGFEAVGSLRLEKPRFGLILDPGVELRFTQCARVC